MRTRLRPWQALLALTVASCTSTPDPDPDPPTALELAIENLGGEAALAEMTSFRFDATGSRSFSNEGVRPGDMLDLASYTATYTHDFENGHLRVDMEKQVHFEALAAFPPAMFTVTVNGDVGSLDQQAGFLPPGALPSQVVGALTQQFRLFNPHVYLRAGVTGELAFSDQGVALLDGVEHAVYRFDTGVAPAELFIELETGTISQLTTIENNQLNRDVPVVVRFGDWAETAGLSFPRSVEVTVNGGEVHTQERSSYQVDPSLGADTFALSPDAVGTTANAADHEWGSHTHNGIDEFFHLTFPYVLTPNTVQTLTPNVTLLLNTWTSMGIRVGDDIAVLEAPLSPAWGETITSEIATAQGGPVSYVIPTHFHQDHAAGVRSLVAEGATLVIPEVIRPFWETTLSAPSTVYPDLLENTPSATPEIATFPDEGAWVLEDNEVKLTVHHIPDNPHSEDLTLTVIDTEGQRFVYVSDLYNAGFGMTLVLGGPEAFFENMRRLSLIDNQCLASVPTTIIPGHGMPQSLADSIAELAGQGIDIGCP